MAKQTINIGTTANDGTGDPLRTAFDKINDNFTELYGSTAEANDLIEDSTPQLGGNLDLNGQKIVTARSNEDIILDPAGTGTIELQANTAVTGTLSVSSTTTLTGAATLSTSLALASGATVTAILDEDNMSSDSATALATQQSIKAYIDAQNVSQALTFVGDDSTGTAVRSGETFQIAGGTGLDSVVSGDTLTMSIDSTVTTLTGSQVLTNKTLTSTTINGATMTGTVSVDNININDSTISTASNADLNLQPGGTGNIVAGAVTINGTTLSSVDSTKITLAENVDITGTLVTSDITTTGQVIITGTLQTDSVLLKDNKVSSANTNDNLEIEAAGTGVVDVQSAMTTVGQTITGTVDLTGQLNADNIRIDANTISATNSNGGINITPDGTGTITLNGNVVAVTNELAAVDVAVSSEIQLGASAEINNIATNSDLVLGTQGTGTIRINNPQTQTTVGAAGAANALPATPTGYLKLNLGGTEYVIPYYAAS